MVEGETTVQTSFYLRHTLTPVEFVTACMEARFLSMILDRRTRTRRVMLAFSNMPDEANSSFGRTVVVPFRLNSLNQWEFRQKQNPWVALPNIVHKKTFG